MGLKVNANKENDVVIVKLLGNLDTSAAPEAEERINYWLEKNSKKIVINLQEDKYVSSAGLRVFLATAKKMTAAGGAVKFCSPNDVVKEILDSSGFTTILDVKESLEEAMNEI